MQETNIENLSGKDRLHMIAKYLDFENISEKDKATYETFPLEFELTTDFILGTQTAMAAAMILVKDMESIYTIQQIAKSFMYHWWLANKENEFTESELVV